MSSSWNEFYSESPKTQDRKLLFFLSCYLYLSAWSHSLFCSQKIQNISFIPSLSNWKTPTKIITWYNHKLVNSGWIIQQNVYISIFSGFLSHRWDKTILQTAGLRNLEELVFGGRNLQTFRLLWEQRRNTETCLWQRRWTQQKDQGGGEVNSPEIFSL